jgi:hypothetical protein
VDQNVYVPQTTIGLSPKATMAGLVPALSTVAAVLVQWAVTGEFDRSELATAVTGLVTAALAAVAAWDAPPGAVPVPVVGPASDELLTVNVDGNNEEGSV